MWSTMTSAPEQLSGRLILATDGSVLAQQWGPSRQWWRLRPDASGDYLRGRWSPGPAMVHDHLFSAVAPLLSGGFLAVGWQTIDPDSLARIAGPAESLSNDTSRWSGEPVVSGPRT